MYHATVVASISTTPAGSGGLLFVDCFGPVLNALVRKCMCVLDGVVGQRLPGLVFRWAQVKERLCGAGTGALPIPQLELGQILELENCAS